MGKKIRVHGVPNTTDGILKPHDIKISEDGEPLKRVQSFEFKVAIGETPVVKIVSLPAGIELGLEGIEIDHEIQKLRIFEIFEKTLMAMDLDFRMGIARDLELWKTATIESLKAGLDKTHAHLTDMIEQAYAGKRSVFDVAVFAIRLANWGMMLADRVSGPHEETEWVKEKNEGEEQDGEDQEKTD